MDTSKSDVASAALCAKCGCETKGEVAWVQDKEWCHPCADNEALPAATYDESCWDLAVAFLVDHPEKDTKKNRHELATSIQRTIEDVIEFQLEAKK